MSRKFDLTVVQTEVAGRSALVLKVDVHVRISWYLEVELILDINKWLGLLVRNLKLIHHCCTRELPF